MASSRGFSEVQVQETLTAAAQVSQSQQESNIEFTEAQVQEALFVANGDTSLAGEVLCSWRRVPPPSDASSPTAPAEVKPVPPPVRSPPKRFSLNSKVSKPEELGDQKASHWQSLWLPDQSPAKSPQLGGRKRANTETAVRGMTEQANRAQSPAHNLVDGLSGWISGKVKSVTETYEMFARGADECPKAAQASRDGFEEFYNYTGDKHRDGFEDFYDYDADGFETPRPGFFGSPQLESTWHLPDLDVLDVDLAPELEKSDDDDDDDDDDELIVDQNMLSEMISQVEESAKQIWGVLSQMSAKFPEDVKDDSSGAGGVSSKPKRRPSSRLPCEASADQRRMKEVASMLSGGWMPPEQVQKLKTELETLQARLHGMALKANSSGSHSVPPGGPDQRRTSMPAPVRKLDFSRDPSLASITFDMTGTPDQRRASLPAPVQPDTIRKVASHHSVGEAVGSGSEALVRDEALIDPGAVSVADSTGSSSAKSPQHASAATSAKSEAVPKIQGMPADQAVDAKAGPQSKGSGPPAAWFAASMKVCHSPRKGMQASAQAEYPKQVPKEPPANSKATPPGSPAKAGSSPAGPPSKSSTEAVSPVKAEALPKEVPKEVPKEAPKEVPKEESKGAPGSKGPPGSTKGKPPPGKGGGKGGPGGGKGPPLGAPGKAPGKAKPQAKPGFPKVNAKPPPLGRKVEWQPLSMESVVGTVFEGLLDWIGGHQEDKKEEPNGTGSAEDVVDEKRLLELFKAREKSSSSKAPKAAPKAKAIQLLPSQRVQNISIALRKQPVTEKMLTALETLDYETDAISAEACEMLMNAVPSLEETRLLLGYTGAVEELGKTEQQLLPLARLEKPAVGQRLRVMLFGRTMGELAKHLREDLGLLKTAFTEARSSRALKVVLYHTVRLGNYINYGALKREDAVAAGFGLDALLKMELFKAAADSRLSLLHTLIIQISNDHPGLAEQVRNELATVGRASRLQFSPLAEDTAAFRRESGHVAVCAKAHATKEHSGESEASESKLSRLECLAKKATEECTALEEELAQTRAAAKETLAFFAVAAKAQETDNKIVELLKLLNRFVETFARCSKQLDENPKLKSLCTGPLADPEGQPAAPEDASPKRRNSSRPSCHRKFSVSEFAPAADPTGSSSKVETPEPAQVTAVAAS